MPRIVRPLIFSPLRALGTGEYNYRSLGIRHIRKLNMSRGGREGNNALCKDDGPSVSRQDSQAIADFVMAEPNVTLAVVEKLLELKVHHVYIYIYIYIYIFC